MGTRRSGTVLVSVGTDYHRFDRLLTWVAEWMQQAPEGVQVVVQHGSSTCPPGAIGYDIVPKPELEALMGRADVVLVQGGPGGIVAARHAGRVPIVVPRVARLNEAVDDHQIAFCRRMSAEGKVLLAESEQELFEALDAALEHPPRVEVADDEGHVAETVERLGRAVDELVSLGARHDHRHVRRVPPHGDGRHLRPGPARHRP